MIETLCRDLETDKVLSEGQLTRHYTLFVDELPAHVRIFSVYLAATHHSRKFCEVRLITLEPANERLTATALRHLAGVAEMRRCLGVPASDWQSEAQASFAAEKPDALWLSSQGEVAIEYDAGSYSPDKIRQKVYAFHHFSGQVWGSPSRKRVSHLRQHLRSAGVKTAPVFAPWI